MAVSMVSNTLSRNYFVWKCECKDKTMRPRGRAIKEGCLKWNTVSSKHRLGEAEIMPRCAYCNRKKRLTPSNTDVYRFDDRDDAIDHEERLNGSVW